jgi:hypothetical protein
MNNFKRFDFVWGIIINSVNFQFQYLTLQYIYVTLSYDLNF